MAFLDTAAFVIFVVCIGTYAFLTRYMRGNGKNSHRFRIELFRKSWLEKRIKKDEQIVIIQAVRNTIMASSIMASATVVAVPLLFGLIKAPQPFDGIPEIGSETFKLALLLGVLVYATVMILFHLRLLQRFTLLVGSDLKQIRRLEGQEPVAFLAEMLNQAYREFSNALRALAYAVAIGLWFYGPHLFILATLALTLVIAREDLMVE